MTRCPYRTPRASIPDAPASPATYQCVLDIAHRGDHVLLVSGAEVAREPTGPGRPSTTAPLRERLTVHVRPETMAAIGERATREGRHAGAVAAEILDGAVKVAK